jgi:Porin subfamily
MRSVLLAIIVLSPFAAMSRAEPLRLDQAEKAATSAKALPAKPPASIGGCAAFGAGFVKVAGSDTCVKIGGAVSVGVGGAAGSR